MIDAGLGETQLNSFLTAMNIPDISTSLLKRQERVIGKAIEEVAEESCRENLRLEKELTIANNEAVKDK